MKRLLLFLSVILSIPVFGGDFRFGLSGGVNLGGIKTDWKYIDEPDVFLRFGYSLGAGTELKLKNQLYLLTDLNFVSKNYAYDPEYYGTGTEGFDRYTILYLDLPVRLSYYYKNIRFSAGPFIDYCISGTNRYNLVYADSTYEEGNKDIKAARTFSTNEVHSERLAVNYLDGGLIFGIGYHTGCYCIDLNYSLGLVNIYPEISGEDSRESNYTKTRLLTLNIFFYL